MGQWNVAPNAVNSVPRDVTLGIDVRDTVHARRDAVLDALGASAIEIAGKRKVRNALRRTPPVRL